MQPRGCKKGSDCDFSHDRSKNCQVDKVPKLCRNSSRCTWKPRCRYVHPEDGESIPQRVPRERNSSGLRERSSRFLQGPDASSQGFGTTSSSQPPPGHRAVEREQQLEEMQVEEGSNKVRVQVHSYSLKDFPILPTPQKVTKIWIQ